jgi:DNA (cytosine-5)-methyltransferase 1
LTLESDKGPADSNHISSLGDNFPKVKDVIRDGVQKKYHCSQGFVDGLHRALDNDLSTLHGRRFIDYRGGHSIHSWEMGTRGVCSPREIQFMNQFILERRNKKFGTHRDGKMLTKEQISTFWDGDDLDAILENLSEMKYLKIVDNDTVTGEQQQETIESETEWKNLTGVQQQARREIEAMKGKTSAQIYLLEFQEFVIVINSEHPYNVDRYKPVAGNYSFEVYKFLDPEKISVTVVASDCSRIGIYHNQQVRRLTPREIARLQGFPDEFILHQNDNRAYFQLGNAVTVPVAKAVCLEVLHQLFPEKECLTTTLQSV